MDSIKVTIPTMHDSVVWKGVYQVPEEMPVEVAAKLVEIRHAEPFKGEVMEDEPEDGDPETLEDDTGDNDDNSPVPGDVSDAGLFDILDGNMARVTEALGTLDDDELERLTKAESDGKTRKGVMAAIADEQAARAGDGDPE